MGGLQSSLAFEVGLDQVRWDFSWTSLEHLQRRTLQALQEPAPLHHDLPSGEVIPTPNLSLQSWVVAVAFSFVTRHS